MAGPERAARDTGTSFIGATNFTNGLGRGITDASQSLPGLAQGLSLGVVSGPLTIAGKQIFDLQLLARALEADSEANILSTPNLVTLDNEEARIIVGQNIPITTGSFTLTGAGSGLTNPFQTFTRQDIGVALRVRPQVAEAGAVKLGIYQEVSSIRDQNNPNGIILNKRALESQVVVDDGQIIVLGGLISDDVNSTVQSVPVLGNIPVIGWLFRYTTRQREKTNLMVFLRPLVIRDSAAAARVTGERYDYIRDVQGSQRLPPSLLAAQHADAAAARRSAAIRARRCRRSLRSSICASGPRRHPLPTDRPMAVASDPFDLSVDMPGACAARDPRSTPGSRAGSPITSHGRNGVIAARRSDGAAEIWVLPEITTATLGEVRRVLGLPLKPVVLTAEAFAARLAQAYTREESGAASLMRRHRRRRATSRASPTGCR